MWSGGANQLDFTTNGVNRLSISSAGALSISGQVVAAVGAVGTPSYSFTGSLTTGMWSGAANQLDFSTNGVDRISISSAGLVNMTGGLNVSGAAFSSRGITDNATATALSLDSGGNVNIPNGTGSLSPVYAGIPQNAQFGATYQLVLSDANKQVYQNAGGTHTYTIPANSSVAFPIGTAITITNGVGAGNLTLNITTDTLNWLPTGATNSRTIARSKQATLLKVGATI